MKVGESSKNRTKSENPWQLTDGYVASKTINTKMSLTILQSQRRLRLTQDSGGARSNPRRQSAQMSDSVNRTLARPLQRISCSIHISECRYNSRTKPATGETKLEH